jgi:hypothetical protein
LIEQFPIVSFLSFFVALGATWHRFWFKGIGELTVFSSNSQRCWPHSIFVLFLVHHHFVLTVRHLIRWRSHNSPKSNWCCSSSRIDVVSQRFLIILIKRVPSYFLFCKCLFMEPLMNIWALWTTST